MPSLLTSASMTTPAACGTPPSSSRSTIRARVHNSPGMSTRGEHLVHADRAFATGGGRLTRLFSPAFSKVLDEIARRLERGGLEAMLPSGGQRRIGFTAPAPTAVVRLHSWMSLVRLALSGSVGWYKAWK